MINNLANNNIEEKLIFLQYRLSEANKSKQNIVQSVLHIKNYFKL